MCIRDSVMTPKSLLRDPRASSTRDELINGKFQEVIDDPNTGKKVTRVVLCTGKIYYDLYEKKIADKRDDVAIVRVEQLYPLPEKKLAKILEKYKGAEPVWVQEEPKNQGYWTFLLRYDQFRNLRLISRKSLASPATGFSNVHKKEQADIVANAFSK